MKKMNKLALFTLLMALGVISAHAEGGTSAYTTLITTAQTTITDVITAVVTAGSAILLAALGLKALPYAYHKIVGFFK